MAKKRGQPSGSSAQAVKKMSDEDRQALERKQSVAGIAAHKLRDCYRSFTPDQIDVMTDPESGLTLRAILERDIAVARAGTKDCTFGQPYHNKLQRIFRGSARIL